MSLSKKKRGIFKNGVLLCLMMFYFSCGKDVFPPDSPGEDVFVRKSLFSMAGFLLEIEAWSKGDAGEAIAAPLLPCWSGLLTEKIGAGRYCGNDGEKIRCEGCSEGVAYPADLDGAEIDGEHVKRGLRQRGQILNCELNEPLHFPGRCPDSALKDNSQFKI